MVTDRIDERTERGGVANALFPAKQDEDTGERLLAYVLDGVLGIQARAQLQVDQFTEVTDEVLLSVGIPFAEIFEVNIIEFLELQAIILKIKCFGRENEHPMAKLYIAEMAAGQIMSKSGAIAVV
jgi:hypothetical protein